MSARAAGEDRSTAVMNAAGQHSVMPIEGLKGNTAGQKKVRRHIVRLKNAVEWD